MCGIAGVWSSSDTPGWAELERMAAALQHRGPDGHGYYRAPGVGLVHTRLALVDVAGGAQPLANEDGSVWLVANGEIHGHRALREELEARGHRFRTRCDVEVALHAYEEWGHGAWARLDGQFALALWDGRRRRLVLVRDRFGVVPLHYTVRPDAVVFGSEAKALLAGGRVPVAWDPEALTHVFTAWAAPDPLTVFAGVRRVAPGTALELDERFVATERRYWQLGIVPAAGAAPSFEQAADGLAELLEHAVRARLDADVPVGACVSGGLDSSVLAALAVRSTPVLDTFALRFDDAAFDEGDAQRRVVEHLGIRHHELRCGAADIRAALADVVWHCESPLLRTAPVPMFLLAAFVRSHGIKAVLSGEGADELLAGYGILKEDKLRRFCARSPASARRAALWARVHTEVAAPGRTGDLWAAFFAQAGGDPNDPVASHRLRWQGTFWCARVLAPEVRAAGGVDRLAARVRASLPEQGERWTPLARAQSVETATLLGPYLLASQGDRVAMAHGVEGRHPFLDHRVAEFCASLPDGYKLRGLRDKLVLRAAARRLLPPDVAGRPKQPYRAPTAAALFADDSWELANDLLAPSRLAESPLLDAAVAARLVAKLRLRRGAGASERESMAAVGLLTLQLLTQQFGPAFAARIDTAAAALRRRHAAVRHDAVHDLTTLRA